MSDVARRNQIDRMRADQAELADRIAHALPHDGRLEVRPGLFFNRVSSPGGRVHVVSEPSFCVIAQGSKEIMLGVETYRYDPAHYLITTMELPLVGEVVEASPDLPYLSLRLVFDPSIVTSVIVESGHPERLGDSGVRALDVSPLEGGLLDATLRLVRLVEDPNEFAVIGPLVIRELAYRLLMGTQGNRMRHLAKFGGQAHRMVRAIKKIRDNFDKSLRIEEIARELQMSVSGFHARFKAATAMSPLQFQKQLRLQEARRLMLTEDYDAAQAGYRVGYDDASHFNREYKRHFGKSPMRDVEHLRELTVSSAAS